MPPRVYRTTGIVLRRMDFDEADRLLTVLTPDRGKLRLLAKGARKVASRKAAHVDLFRQVDLLVHQGRSFGIISQVETVRTFAGLADDLERLVVANYMAELADTFAREEEASPALYELVLEGLDWLESGYDPQLGQRYFELHLLGLEGFRPELYRCLDCGEWIQEQVNVFDSATGGMRHPHCCGLESTGQPVSVEAQKVLRYLQRTPPQGCQALRLTPPVEAEITRLMRGYLRSVLDWPPRSDRFVDAVHKMSASPSRPPHSAERS